MRHLFLFSFLLIYSLPLYSKPNKNIVFWLSIDGFKADYLEKADTPNLDKMISKSIFSKKLTPVFPSITFPSHSAQATGVTVKEHGIPLNTFYDKETGKTKSYPDDSKLLQSEPIWQTVKRRGLRSAVLNWPLSFKQKNKYKSDYFYENYESDASDEQKIDGAIAVWEKDFNDGRVLDLVMAYIVGPDSIGHQYGPNDERVFKEVNKVDLLIGKLKAKIVQIAKSKKGKDYNFYLLITTDHGMTQVKSGVNFSLMSNLSPSSKIKIMTGGPVGHVFFNKTSEHQRKLLITNLKKEYSKYPFVKAFTKAEMPEHWGYGHSTRVGDLVVVLESGYIFMNSATKVTVPIEELGGPFGAHGFDPKLVPEMLGIMILWRTPEIGESREIKAPVDSLQLHPTVSKLLGILPAANAKGKVIGEINSLLE